MPSFKSLLPLVLLAAAVLGSPQGPVDLVGTAQSAVSKTLKGREEGPRREIIQVYTRQILNEKGAGGNAGNGGKAGSGGEGIEHGKGGNGARGGAAGNGGDGNYFSGKFSGDGQSRGEKDGEEWGNRFKRVYRRQETVDHNGAGGTGGFGGDGSSGGNGKEYGRGGMGAEGGKGGKGGQGQFFSGVAKVEKKGEFY